MNSTDPLEKQLASWNPRPPSPGLEARLFGSALRQTRRSAEAASDLARWLGWGVPSLGTAFLVASLWIQPAAQVASPNSFHAAQLAALRSASEQSSQNALPVWSIAWTNSAHPRSTNGSWVN